MLFYINNRPKNTQQVDRIRIKSLLRKWLLLGFKKVKMQVGENLIELSKGKKQNTANANNDTKMKKKDL